MRLPAIAAVCALLGSAEAAVIQYELTFTKSDGTHFGTGAISYNPEITVEIQWDHNNFYCRTPSPFCETVAVWTPIDAFFDIPGDFKGAGSDPWFVEGTAFTGDFKGRPEADLFENFWSVDPRGVDGDSFGLGYLPGFTSGFFEFVGFIDGEFDAFSGRVDFERVGEIPLPGAAWLFMAGISALWSRRASLNAKSRPLVARW